MSRSPSMSGEGKMPATANDIAVTVISQFSCLPQKRKPTVRGNGLHEWVPLAGLVAEFPDGTLKCLSLATGMKCLPHNKLPSASGLILHDSHAEILAMRGLNHYLLTLCHELLSNPDVPVGEDSVVCFRRPNPGNGSEEQQERVRGGPLFQINSQVKLHLYISHLPCGDASMELTMSEQADATPWTTAPLLLSLPATERGPAAVSTAPSLPVPSSGSPSPIPSPVPSPSCSATTQTPSTTTTTTTTTNSSSTTTTSPSPPTSCTTITTSSTSTLTPLALASPPPQTTYLPGRSHFSNLSIPRRKPSRPDCPHTLSKSCSDKLSSVQCLSLLSSLSSLFLAPTPEAYIEALVVPEGQLSVSARGMRRAFSADSGREDGEGEGRMRGVRDKKWTSSDGGSEDNGASSDDRYHFHPFTTQGSSSPFPYSRESISIQPDVKLAPSNLSCLYTASTVTTNGLNEGLVGGVLQGRKVGDPKGASAVSRRRMWELARSISALLDDEDGLVVREALSQKTYGEVKGSAALEGRRRVAKDIREGVLKGWVRNTGDDGFGLGEECSSSPKSKNPKSRQQT